MYCRKCGAENDAGSRFCCKCGAPVQGIPEGTEGADGGSHRRNRKILCIVLASCVLVASVAIAAAAISKKSSEKRFGDNVTRAGKYMEELDYDKAEDSYLKAINIDEKQEEPYLQLARIYEKKNEPEKARAILEKGVKNTGSGTIKNKYNLYTYVDEVLIPELGQCSPGTYTTEYKKSGQYSAYVESIHSEKGVVTSRIMDFDSDGEEELLVAVMDNMAEDELFHTQRNKIVLQMYESSGGKVVKNAEWSVSSHVLGTIDFEEDMLFLKEQGETVYICGSFSSLAYTLADGWGFESFVLTYDGGFQKYTGTDGETGGSSFEFYESESYIMADRLERIGLTRSASDIRDTWMMKLSMEDEKDDLLFTIAGKRQQDNFPSHYGDINPEELGKIDLDLAIWQQGEYKKQDGQSTAVSESDTKPGVDYRAAYAPIVEQALEDYGKYNTYALWDIDRDGIQELFVLCGHSEADYMYEVYTVSDGSAAYMGEFSGSHTALYGPEEDGEAYIIAAQCHMDRETIYHVSVSDGKITGEQISQREVPGGADYYTNANELPYADVSDLSLLDEAE